MMHAAIVCPESQVKMSFMHDNCCSAQVTALQHVPFIITGSASKFGGCDYDYGVIQGHACSRPGGGAQPMSAQNA